MVEISKFEFLNFNIANESEFLTNGFQQVQL